MRKAIHSVTIVLAVVSAVCVVAIALSITVDVVLRNTRGSGIKGVVEYTEILLTAVVYLALAEGQRTNSHIRLVLVTELMPPSVARWLRIIGLVLTLGLAITLAYLTTERAIVSFQTDEFRYGLLRVPTRPARAAIGIGFIALSLETLLTLIDQVTRRRTPSTTEADTEVIAL